MEFKELNHFPEGRFRTIYELEAQEFKAPPSQQDKSLSGLFLLLFKASGIFFLITFIIFGIVNYQFIRNQLVDWWGGSGQQERFVGDKNENGLPDWWERRYLTGGGMDPFGDLDNDFAINLLEYQFGTDPNNPDTDGDGYFDGEEIIKGYNPNGVGRLDSDKDGIYDWQEDIYGLDKEDPNDASGDLDNDGLTNAEEIHYNSDLRNPDTDNDGTTDGVEVAQGRNPSGEGRLREVLSSVTKETEKDSDGDGLSDIHEELFGTDPANPDTDGDGELDFEEVSQGRDPTGEGSIKASIELPSLKIKAPLVWSQAYTEEEIDKDLLSGVIHFPGMAIPGLRGNSYITGHSSYYSWVKSDYKEIFKDLDGLKKGHQVIFHYELSNNKRVDVIYEITSSEVVLPNDKRLFRDFEGYEVTLVTCWPVGTDLKRLMVKGRLIQPDIGN